MVFFQFCLQFLLIKMLIPKVDLCEMKNTKKSWIKRGLTFTMHLDLENLSVLRTTVLASYFCTTFDGVLYLVVLASSPRPSSPSSLNLIVLLRSGQLCWRTIKNSKSEARAYFRKKKINSIIT